MATNFNYRLQATAKLAVTLAGWTDLTNFTATNTRFNFADTSATISRARFYRVVSP